MLLSIQDEANRNAKTTGQTKAGGRTSHSPAQPANNIAKNSLVIPIGFVF
jgi:hypothetical protein